MEEGVEGGDAAPQTEAAAVRGNCAIKSPRSSLAALTRKTARSKRAIGSSNICSCFVVVLLALLALVVVVVVVVVVSARRRSFERCSALSNLDSVPFTCLSSGLSKLSCFNPSFLVSFLVSFLFISVFSSGTSFMVVVAAAAAAAVKSLPSSRGSFCALVPFLLE